MTLRLLYIRKIVQEDEVIIHYAPIEDNISALGTKFLNKNRHRHLIGLVKDFRGYTNITGSKWSI